MDRDAELQQPGLGDAVSILQSITDAFFRVDAEWRFTYLNRQAESVLGQQAAELIGKTLWEAYPGTQGSEFEIMYRRAVAEDRPLTFNAYYPDHQRWYEVHAYPAPNGLSVYFRDATERIEAENRLRESEMRFRLMADSIPQILWISDAQGRLEFLNQQWSAYTGASPHGVGAAGTEADFIHPDDIGATTRAWEEAGRHGGTFIAELRIRSAKGDYRWFLVRAEPQRDAGSGRIVRWFGTSTDVHESKRLEASLREREAHYRELFDSIDEGFCTIEVIFDDAGKAIDYRFCEVNAMFVQQTGLLHAAGRRMRELAPDHEAHWFDIYGQVARTGEPVRFENEAKQLNRWYDVYAFRPGEAAANKVAVLFKDISARKRQEQELHQAARSKDEFLAMLAHELRNPLAPIGAAADMLRLAASDEKRVRQASEVIGRQVRHMTSLVDDLLDVSRVSGGRIALDTQPLDTRKIVADALEQVRPLIETQRHTIGLRVSPDPAWVAGDANRLVQVVANLLNNAAKYTDEGGNIEVRIDVEAAHVRISVSDNGIGMPGEFLDSVFEMFTQAQRTADRSQGGLGIGLALVKSLVELHGGTITAHSAGLGQGSEFVMRLPRFAAPVAQARPRDGAQFPGAPAGLRVMVVDDNADAASMLAMFLEAAGYEVSVENDSLRALERAASERPDVLLLDIGMPGIDGNELARRLRALPATAHAVLIAVTGYGEVPERQRGAGSCFDQHFVKPVDATRLMALLSALGNARGAES